MISDRSYDTVQIIVRPVHARPTRIVIYQQFSTVVERKRVKNGKTTGRVTVVSLFKINLNRLLICSKK